jgi:hypothetical protein
VRMVQGRRLEFRVEAFNFFNTTSFFAPGLDVAILTFGVVLAIGPTQPGYVQLPLRLAF